MKLTLNPVFVVLLRFTLSKNKEYSSIIFFTLKMEIILRADKEG